MFINHGMHVCWFCAILTSNLSYLYFFHGMSSTSPVPVGFLTDYVEGLLLNSGLSLTPEQQKIYLPQLLAQVQVRLGLELLPKLNSADRAEFIRLSNAESADGSLWAAFWQRAVPNFNGVIEDVLATFAARTAEILK